jgi:hypothetical protein
MIWNEHVKNRNAFPPEERAKYHGKYVAWNLEGTAIVASGHDDREVLEAARASGWGPEQVVFSYVPLPDEILLEEAAR